MLELDHEIVLPPTVAFSSGRLVRQVAEVATLPASFRNQWL